MGLDMYLRGDKYKRTEFKRDESGELERTKDGDIIPVNVPMVDGFERKSEILSLGYWRKHAPLHKLIVDTFADGVDECQVIPLTAGDCRKIAQMLRDRDFPSFHECDGFFFGKGDWWRECCDDADEDADLFERAADWAEICNESHWHSVEYQASW